MTSLDLYWKTFALRFLSSEKDYISFDITKIYLYYALYRIWSSLIGVGAFSLLEVGSGSGMGLRFLADAFRIESVGIERNRYAYELAGRIKADCDRLFFYRGDFLNWPMADLYDVVFSVGVVEHYHPKEARELLARHFALCKRLACVLLPNETDKSIYCDFLDDDSARKCLTYPEKHNCEFTQVRMMATSIPGARVSDGHVLVYSTSQRYRTRVKDIFGKYAAEVMRLLERVDTRGFPRLYELETLMPPRLRASISFFRMIVMEKAGRS